MFTISTFCSRVVTQYRIKQRLKNNTCKNKTPSKDLCGEEKIRYSYDEHHKSLLWITNLQTGDDVVVSTTLCMYALTTQTFAVLYDTLLAASAASGICYN